MKGFENQPTTKTPQLFRESKSTKRNRFVTLLPLCLVFQQVLLWSRLDAAPKSGANPPAKLKIEETPLNRDVKAPISFAPVAKKDGPSVVNIYSTMTIRERPSMNPFFGDPFFRRFFGDQ